MSLAMYAAPLNNNGENELYSDNNLSNMNADNTYISMKRNSHNKTQKRMPSYNNEKVNSVLQSIHDNLSSNENSLADFKPLAPPTSVGVENTRIKENMTSYNEMDYGNKVSPSFDLNNDQDMDMQSLKNNYMDKYQVKEYYKNLSSNFDEKKLNGNYKYYNSSTSSENYFPQDSNQSLIDKINYMINLLEEQKDEKTNNVTEEVVLYSFLGVFIIFVVDSFARVGKYVR